MLERILAIALLNLLVGASSLAQNEDEAALPDHALGRLHGAEGERTLADYRGRPLLFLHFARDEAGKAAVEWAAEKWRDHRRDQLVVILVPTRPLSSESAAEERAGLALLAPDHELVLSGPMSWHRKSEQTDPSFLLVSCHGHELLSGGLEGVDAGFKKAMRADAKLRKKGWGDTPLERKARVLAYIDERYTEAWISLGSSPAPGMREEIEAAVEKRVELIERLIDQGRFLVAERRLERLAKGIGSVPSYKEKSDRLEAMLQRAAGERGLREAKALDQQLDRIRAGRATEKDVSGLGNFIEKISHEKIKERARTWIEVAEAEIRLLATEADYFTDSKD